MRIVGFLETSLVDWDGRISSVVVIGGCNFTCPFCHNHRVADNDLSRLPAGVYVAVAPGSRPLRLVRAD